MQGNKKEEIHQRLLNVNEQFAKLFSDYNIRSEILTKKYTASLLSQIFGCLEQGSTQTKNQTRQSFLANVRAYVVGMVQNHILQKLSQCHDDDSITRCIIEKWEQFKRFVFYYFTLFQNANHYYQTAYKAFISQGKPNKIQANQSIFPIPTIAVFYFKTFVFNRYRKTIQKQVLKLFAEERNGRIIERQNLRILCQLIYVCGMGQLARIKAVKEINNETAFRFYACTQKQFVKQFSNQGKNPQKHMRDNILNKITTESILFYKQLFENKISNLSPYQDFQTVIDILEKEEEKSDYYLCSEKQSDFYKFQIVKEIVNRDLEYRLTRENSFKYYLQKFSYSSDHYLQEIKTFMKPIFGPKWKQIKIVEEIMRNHLIECGNRIKQKINKRKQYVTEVIELKKSVNRIIDETMDKNWEISLMRDKVFKKILDSVEASRNLAEFADWKIKECIKAKMGEEEANENLTDIFFILENLVATDSYLIYHQEMQGKRLIDALNDPKVQIETIMLNKMAEKIGTVSVGPHFNMIKDINFSQQITQKISPLIPRWSLRVISPTFWPDNTNKNKLQIQAPEAIRMTAQKIGSIFHEQNGHKFLSWKFDRGFSLFQGRFETGKFRFQAQNSFLMLLFHISQASNHQILFGNLLQKVEIKNDGYKQYLMKCVSVLIDNGLLIRDSNSHTNQSFSEGECLKINMKYKPLVATKPNQTIMIKVSAQLHKAMHQSSVDQTKVMKERQKVVEAVLVKLLKHSHSTGVNKLSFQQLYKGICEDQYLKKFQFSESVVKKRLQELIARGYCERDENDRKVYHYIA